MEISHKYPHFHPKFWISAKNPAVANQGPQPVGSGSSHGFGNPSIIHPHGRSIVHPNPSHSRNLEAHLLETGFAASVQIKPPVLRSIATNVPVLLLQSQLWPWQQPQRWPALQCTALRSCRASQSRALALPALLCRPRLPSPSLVLPNPGLHLWMWGDSGVSMILRPRFPSSAVWRDERDFVAWFWGDGVRFWCCYGGFRLRFCIVWDFRVRLTLRSHILAGFTGAVLKVNNTVGRIAFSSSSRLSVKAAIEVDVSKVRIHAAGSAFELVVQPFFFFC